ncbi:XdhC family protein [Methylomarinum vadi]|uniref:XdhC family protein n=1 Tax=Methylomarinum vadi TaxID=438855 RepID=UPI0004DF6E5B|nr:XdhC/CoxI family protein [Methylomarinum vadi]
MHHTSNHLIDAYRRLQQRPETLVLASIIETSGSTYQKAGARMLISRKGEMTGLLGGGCFERDLVEQAQSVFDSGVAKTVFYDMRAPEDMIWGLGLGCNGAVRVLLQLLQAERDFSPLNVFADVAEADESGVLVTCYESSHPKYTAEENLFLPASALTTPTSSDFGTEPLMATAKQVFLQQQPRAAEHSIEGRPVKAFYDFIGPPCRLLVLGAGADALPLVQTAASLGWRVTVADYRPGHIDSARFPQAEKLLLLAPEELNEKLALNRFDALVLMTHNFDYDRRYLQRLANNNIPFIGLLGPAQRRDMLLQSLGNTAERIRESVFGPIGLDIGAQTPEEIALSIMAGIHAVLNGRGGGHLDSRSMTAINEQADDLIRC